MKNFILLSFLVFFTLSCRQSEVKVEKNQFIINSDELLKANLKIEQFLKDTILNVNSFIPKDGIFEVDSAFNSPFDNLNLRTIFLKYIDEEKSFDSLIESIKDNNYIYKNSNQKIDDSLLIKNQYDIIELTANELRVEYGNYEKKFIGWKVKYQFQIIDFKNENKYVNCVFLFDSSFDKILKFKDNLSDKDLYLKKNIIDKLSGEGFRRSLKLLKFEKDYINKQ